MKILKNILKVLAILVLAFFAFAFWYKNTYAMEEVATYEINDPDLENKVLIATQGSKYKNVLVESVIDSLSQSQIYIKVIDVSAIENQNVDDWDAIILIHTWEYGKPPEAVESFMDGKQDLSKIFSVITSGSGEEKMEGVDAITGASKKEDMESHRSAILQFLNQNLTPND
ncbi:hypothetical protein [Ekhidna sp.]